MFQPTKEFHERMKEYHSCTLNLKNLIISLNYLMKKHPEIVGKKVFGFHNPHSYRGYYCQLCFEPIFSTIEEMLESAKSALNKSFFGRDGDEYLMTEVSECYIAEQGYTDYYPDGITYDRLIEMFELNNEFEF